MSPGNQRIFPHLFDTTGIVGCCPSFSVFLVPFSFSILICPAVLSVPPVLSVHHQFHYDIYDNDDKSCKKKMPQLNAFRLSLLAIVATAFYFYNDFDFGFNSRSRRAPGGFSVCGCVVVVLSSSLPTACVLSAAHLHPSYTHLHSSPYSLTCTLTTLNPNSLSSTPFTHPYT